jgi:hypothetical protein
MEVIMHLISRACLIFTFFISVACRGPEVDFVFLENVANERLQATVIFEGPDVASQPLAFNLEPGQRDGWRYLVDKKTNKADWKFQSLLIKSAKCERHIERPVLEKHIRKKGAWVLRIDDALILC